MKLKNKNKLIEKFNFEIWNSFNNEIKKYKNTHYLKIVNKRTSIEIIFSLHN